MVSMPRVVLLPRPRVGRDGASCQLPEVGGGRTRLRCVRADQHRPAFAYAEVALLKKRVAPELAGHHSDVRDVQAFGRAARCPLLHVCRHQKLNRVGSSTQITGARSAGQKHPAQQGLLESAYDGDFGLGAGGERGDARGEVDRGGRGRMRVTVYGQVVEDRGAAICIEDREALDNLVRAVAEQGVQLGVGHLESSQLIQREHQLPRLALVVALPQGISNRLVPERVRDRRTGEGPTGLREQDEVAGAHPLPLPHMNIAPARGGTPERRGATRMQSPEDGKIRSEEPAVSLQVDEVLDGVAVMGLFDFGRGPRLLVITRPGGLRCAA